MNDSTLSDERIARRIALAENAETVEEPCEVCADGTALTPDTPGENVGVCRDCIDDHLRSLRA